MMLAVETALRRAVAILRDGGAKVICIPCNTAHTWYDQICDEAGSNVEVFHMIDLASKKMKDDGVKKIGLLATHGTRESRLYEKSVEKVYAGQEYEFLYPTEEEQRILYDEGIMAVKSGVPGKDAYPAQEPCVKRLLASGAERIVLGCTEIPIIFEGRTEPYLLDAMDQLARVAVQKCKI